MTRDSTETVTLQTPRGAVDAPAHAEQLMQELNRNGYMTHRPYNDAAVFRQKRVTDDRGTKYFVNFLLYRFEPLYSDRWTMEVTNNEPHITLAVHSPFSLAEYERLAETFWRAMGCEYYELTQEDEPDAIAL